MLKTLLSEIKRNKKLDESKAQPQLNEAEKEEEEGLSFDELDYRAQERALEDYVNSLLSDDRTLEVLGLDFIIDDAIKQLKDLGFKISESDIEYDLFGSGPDEFEIKLEAQYLPKKWETELRTAIRDLIDRYRSELEDISPEINVNKLYDVIDYYIDRSYLSIFYSDAYGELQWNGLNNFPNTPIYNYLDDNYDNLSDEQYDLLDDLLDRICSEVIEITDDIVERIEDFITDTERKIYKDLKNEFEYQTSMETFAEYAKEMDYRFSEDGKLLN